MNTNIDMTDVLVLVSKIEANTSKFVCDSNFLIRNCKKNTESISAIKRSAERLLQTMNKEIELLPTY